MEKIFTKAEAVEEYGTEEQKGHFKKYKKFTNKKIEDALIKTLEQNFEVVERVKVGRSIAYKVNGERAVLLERKDMRVSNGDWSKPYTKNMDIVVVSILEQEKESRADQTLNDWLLDFNLITPQAYDLLKSRFNEEIKERHLIELKENKIIKTGEERVLIDYVEMVLKLQGELASTLNRMSKAKIIEFYPVFWGYNGEKIQLSPETHKKALKLRKKLMEQYGITNEWHVSNHKNTEKVQLFLKEYSKQLAKVTDDKGNELGLKNIFKTYAVILKATKKATIKYLEKYAKDAIEQYKEDSLKYIEVNKSDYAKNRLEYATKEAESKEKKFFEPKTNSEAIEKFGAGAFKPKLEDFSEKQKDYYALFFDRLYVKRIQELEKHYGHKFLEA